MGYTASTFGEVAMYLANGTLLGISPPDTIKVNTWHYMEFEIVIHNTAGSIRVWVDGFPAIDVTNIDTRMFDDTDGQNVAYLGLRTDHSWQGVQIDDLYIKLGGRLGERRIETIVPNADTATKMWTPNAGTDNFSRVNESLVDMTTYVSSNQVNATDLYELQNMAATPVSIDFVQISAYANKEDAATRGLALIADLGGQQIISPTKSISTSVNRIEHGMPTKPGGGVWTKADVDALRAGARITV
jgi:dipeptidyl aminopeptidase/acylaminoacyl peptidase